MVTVVLTVIVEWLGVTTSQLLSDLAQLRQRATKYVLHLPVQSKMGFHESWHTHCFIPVFLELQ